MEHTRGLGLAITSPIGWMPNNHPTTPAALAAANPSTNDDEAYHIRLVQHPDSLYLRFETILRDLKPSDPPICIGRYAKLSAPDLIPATALSSAKIHFRSKVVSRTHAEIHVTPMGKFMIRDMKSSSGTFLNHVRFSKAGTESQEFELKDGDTLQLGTDYQGGVEEIYESVKIKIEVWDRRRSPITSPPLTLAPPESLQVIASPLVTPLPPSSPTYLPVRHDIESPQLGPGTFPTFTISSPNLPSGPSTDGNHIGLLTRLLSLHIAAEDIAGLTGLLIGSSPDPTSFEEDAALLTRLSSANVSSSDIALIILAMRQRGGRERRERTYVDGEEEISDAPPLYDFKDYND